MNEQAVALTSERIVVEQLEGAVAGAVTVFTQLQRYLDEERRLGSQAIVILERALKQMEEHKKLLAFLPLLEETLLSLKRAAQELTHTDDNERLYERLSVTFTDQDAGKGGP